MFFIDHKYVRIFRNSELYHAGIHNVRGGKIDRF